MVINLFSLFLAYATQNYSKLFRFCPCLANNKINNGVYGKSTVSGLWILILTFSILVDYIDIAISHYYRQNGDMMPDPDILLRIFKSDSLVFPLSYQDSLTYNEILPNYIKI